MPAPYRKAKGHAWMWLLLVFGAIGFSMFLGFQFPKNVEWWVAVPVFGGPILIAIIACAIIQARIDKNRRQRMLDLLQSMGLDAYADENKEAAAAFFAQLAHLETSAMLRDGAANLKWFAQGSIGEQYVVAFEHEYVTGSGKTTQVHTSTCVGFPSDKGGITFIRPRFGEARSYRKFETAFKLGDEEFDKEWIIWGERNYADAMFTPELLVALADSPRGEWWCIGGGWECCLTRNALDAENLGKFVSHVNAVAKLI